MTMNLSGTTDLKINFLKGKLSTRKNDELLNYINFNLLYSKFINFMIEGIAIPWKYFDISKKLIKFSIF